MSLTRQQIITHRGLVPSRKNFFPESSYEAFENLLARGFGIEFDPNFVKDGIVVSHDANLKRITEGRDNREFKDLTVAEITDIKYGKQKKGRTPTFDELMALIRKSKSKVNALHLKGKFQEDRYIDRLVDVLKKHGDVLSKIFIFDAKPEVARFLKNKIPKLTLAPSVSHPFDIKRYNKAVLGTLVSVSNAIDFKKEGIYDWVWLDEWDLTGENGTKKSLLNKKVFDSLKKVGYKIALVTPELHGTSPGLLGREAHQDAENKEKLFSRMKKIIALNPDAICTDYPEEALKL
ncbi:MAG: glycerophosphodiester phosphodiesterase family protein [bacterium]|nr:glycerophosphodiester phosphodiesterase family protein [bacterium]